MVDGGDEWVSGRELIAWPGKCGSSSRKDPRLHSFGGEWASCSVEIADLAEKITQSLSINDVTWENINLPPQSHCDVRFYIYRSSVFGIFDARVVQSSIVIGVKTRLWSVLVDIETR